MATYKGIKGVKLQSLATDPSVFADGEVWYNTSSYTLKYNVEGAGAWASANAIPAFRLGAGGCGTQTAGVYVGGSQPTPTLNNALEFDGTDWTIAGTMNTPSIYATFTAGTQTAVVAAGGYSESPAGNKTATEKYDGTTWTTGNPMVGIARDGGGCAGIQTAAIGFGGNQAGSQKLVEEYDGTSWTAATALTSDHARCFSSQTGTQTAALCIAGNNPGVVEEWDGSTWTEKADVNTTRQYGGGVGTVTAALIVAGYPPSAKSTATEKWDGTSWTEVGDITTGKAYVYGFGSQSAAVLAGGVTGPSSTANSTTNEVWNDPIESTKTVTAS